MLKRSFLALLLLSFGLVAQAQRFSVLDSQYILEQLPEYKSVQRELEDVSTGWQREIEEKQKAIKTKFDDYQARRPLLSQEEQRNRQQEIERLERELAELRSKYFGYEGELFKLREEKMRPIQLRLMQAITDVAKAKRSDLVLDRASSGAVVLWANDTYDISNDVLRQLGVTPTGNPPGVAGTPASGTGAAPGTNTPR
jgi:outer membrane protein